MIRHKTSLAETHAPALSVRTLREGEVPGRSWNEADVLLLPGVRDTRYCVGYAASDPCLEAVLRLRYEVFNLELGEGLAESETTGLDKDEYDPQMTHLVLLDRGATRVLGTYRLQTAIHAQERLGLYSAREYALDSIRPLFGSLAECGRACIASGHRNMTSLLMLWTGIRGFMDRQQMRHLMGCCSVTSTNPVDGWRILKTLRREDYLHPDYFEKATPDFSCGDPAQEQALADGEALPLPKLFATYMRLGARVISEPAIDREFGTVDFLVLFDVESRPAANFEFAKSRR